MLSFRVEEAEARHATLWAQSLGIDRSELLRDALRRYLAQLASEKDAETWQQQPLTADELALTAIEDGVRLRIGLTGPMQRGEIGLRPQVVIVRFWCSPGSVADGSVQSSLPRSPGPFVACL